MLMISTQRSNKNIPLNTQLSSKLLVRTAGMNGGNGYELKSDMVTVDLKRWCRADVW